MPSSVASINPGSAMFEMPLTRGRGRGDSLCLTQAEGLSGLAENA